MIRRGFTLIETVVAMTLLLVGLAAVIALTNTSVFLHGESHNRWEATVLADRLLEETRGQDLSTLDQGLYTLPDVHTLEGLDLHPSRTLDSISTNPPCWKLRIQVAWVHRDRPYEHFRECFLTKVLR